MIHSVETQIQPKVGQPMGLGRGHVAALSLVFHYRELVHDGVWNAEAREVALVEGEHFDLDAPTGQITLLEHSLWDSPGLWRAIDREESLLYKGQVKAPQYIAVSFDHYAPAEASIALDKAQVQDENLTISVECEVDGDVPIAIHSGERKVGSVTVEVSGGSGEHVMNVGAGVPAGRYALSADRDVLDPTWNLPVWGSDGVQVEVTDA